MNSIAQSLVKFEKETQSIRHQVEMQPTDALEFAQTCEGINAATNDNLEYFVTGVNKIVPTILFGAGNPNNGRTHHTFTVGQECSRVIYVTIIKAYIKSWTDKDYTTMGQRLTTQAEMSGADEAEVTCNDNGCFTFRAWWD